MLNRTVLFTRMCPIALGAILFAVGGHCGAAYAQTETSAQEKLAPSLPPLPELPLSPTEKAVKDGTALKLSLKEVTKLALQNNLEIAIQDTNESLNQQSIVQAYGPYDPTLTLSLGVQSQKNPNTNYSTRSTSGNYSKLNYSFWNASYSQDFRTGGSLSFSSETNRRDNDISFFLFNPQFNSNTTLKYTQPLLRNLRIDSNRGQIKIANLDLKISDSQFRAKVVDTIARVQQQYWSLVEAIRNYEIQRESVRLAQTTLRDHSRKVEIGTMAPINVVEDRATLAQREESMAAAEQQIYDAENTLLTMISSDRKGEIWSQTVVPTDSPDFVEQKIDLAAALDTALQRHPDLEQSNLRLQQNDVRQRMSTDSRKWKVDLTGQFGATGVAGPQSYQRDPITGQQVIAIDPGLVGGVGKAYRLAFGNNFLNWGIGFDVQIPLRNRSVDAQVARYKITKQQELLDRRNKEMKIQAEIRTAYQKIETDRKRVESAKARRTYAKEQLTGEQKRFDAGASENYQVLQRQIEFATAQYAELQALISYQKSIIDFQKKQYTLLESNDFVMATGSSNKVPDLK